MQVLQYIAQHDTELNFISMLPLAGHDGSLQYRAGLHAAGVDGKVSAKTGSLQGSKSVFINGQPAVRAKDRTTCEGTFPTTSPRT